MKKYLLLFLILAFNLSFAQSPDKSAKGFFLAVGVGPRFPMGDFGNTSKLGYGLSAEISYTNSDSLPFFIFLKSGFETYPGSQDFYSKSNYSNLSTNLIPVKLGVQYFLPPLVKSQALLMPILELSASYGLFHTLNEFKPGSGQTNFSENKSRFGFSAGAGISAFMLEILASYNYFDQHQYIALDLKVRYPIYINY